MHLKKSFIEKPEKKRKRSFFETPECAFQSKEWTFWFAHTYEQINKIKYSKDPQKEIPIIAKNIYPIFFYDLKWSALEFMFFIKSNFKKNTDIKKIPTLSTFHFKKEIMQSIAKDFNKTILLNRREYLNNLIYLQFYPLSITQDDFMMLFKNFEDDLEGFMFNYGIQNFHKYIQKKQNIDFEEARNFTKKCIVQILKKHEHKEKILKKLFLGISKNSIKWEPCTSQYDEINIVIDWRQDFRKIWELCGSTKKTWWREQKNNKIFPLKSVKKFFEN